jgi:ketosteroid isomerase-like protein
MRLFYRVAASAVALLLAAATLSAQRGAPSPEAAAVTAISTLERQWLEHEHDRATLERMLADDFVHPVAAGVFLTRAAHIDWAVNHPPPAGERHRFGELHVRVYGDTAIATGIVITTDANERESRTIFTDVFARRAGRWQAVNAQENPIPR